MLLLPVVSKVHVSDAYNKTGRIKFIAAQYSLTLSNHYILSSLSGLWSTQSNVGGSYSWYTRHVTKTVHWYLISIQCLLYVHIPPSQMSCNPRILLKHISNTSNFHLCSSFNVHDCVSKKVPTFYLSVTSSNLNRFSKFLHCWKVYEICYKTYMTLSISP